VPFLAHRRTPWLVLAFWLVLGAGGFVLLPSVSTVVAGQSNGTIPEDAPTLQSLATMNAAFGEGAARSYVFVAFENRSGLTDADRAAYADLVRRLTPRTDYVASVQDHRVSPALTAALTSKDGQALYLPVGLRSALGTAAVSEQVGWVREQVGAAKDAAGAEATIAVTGDPANFVDLTEISNEAGLRVGLISVAFLLVILTFIYRRVVTVLVPLVTIGLATLCGLAAIALAGELGVGLSTYTEAFCLAVILGAGTDYSIFLISRFREEYARTGDVVGAVATSVRRIGGALIASAGTVALGALVLHFAQLSIFRTTGPAIAVAVGATLLVSLTVTPALLLLFGERIGPAVAKVGWWDRIGGWVATYPARILTAGTGALLALALVVPTVTLAYGDTPSDPDATESNRGTAVLDRHFGAYATEADYLVVVADHDLRSSGNLTALAALSSALGEIDGVTAVRSLAQPDGAPLPVAQLSALLARQGSKDVAPVVAQYLSADGRTTRLQVFGDTDPRGAQGIERFDALRETGRASLAGTPLAGSEVLVTGASGASADLRTYFGEDFLLVALAVLLAVLVITVLALRALVAPLFLLVSVVLSYAAALGAGVLLFQHVLGQDIVFTAPVLSFVLLVAVGADYNILLMSRMREEPGLLTRAAVGRAVTATGPVITSAGIIFASTFVPLLGSSVAAISQMCFVMLVGLLLDTFVVRTLVVPACAALLGDRSWWPGNSREAV